mmetsp:Transcript_18441/g.26011  ORF Transcript_18441/g.26011 Transcript_18441/m.26011 type:complete len:478 (+) Transcript_18441:98-1531(+)
MTDTNNEDTAAAAAKARAAAEARRQRILSGSKTRMAVASGETVLSTTSTTEDESTTSTSTSAKMAALRRRRFAAKKKAASAAQQEETETASASEPPKEKEQEETTTKTETETTPTETKTTETATEPTTTTTSTEEETTADATQRKYMGVAKMRRKMLKERQQKEASGVATTTSKSATSATTTKPPSLVVPSTTAKSAVLVTHKVPIFLHALTILLLFLAGLDVGLHPDIMHPTDALHVHYSYAVQDHGVGFYTNFIEPRFLQSNKKEDEPKTILQDSAVMEESTEQQQEEEEAEFEDHVDAGTPEEITNDPIIDPLFRVDLDLLTSGPGILMMLGRGAVKCHRFLLWLWYELPLSILTTILSLPQSLMKCPPIFCIVAVLVRQGLKLAGANLPDATSGDGDGSTGEKKSLDVLGMIKQTVMGTLKKMFPTAVSLYRVWTDVRADMYVVLCGMFVGLAYTHQQHYSLLQQEQGGRDEL